MLEHPRQGTSRGSKYCGFPQSHGYHTWFREGPAVIARVTQEGHRNESGVKRVGSGHQKSLRCELLRRAGPYAEISVNTLLFLYSYHLLLSDRLFSISTLSTLSRGISHRETSQRSCLIDTPTFNIQASRLRRAFYYHRFSTDQISHWTQAVSFSPLQELWFSAL